TVAVGGIGSDSAAYQPADDPSDIVLTGGIGVAVPIGYVGRPSPYQTTDLVAARHFPNHRGEQVTVGAVIAGHTARIVPSGNIHALQIHIMDPAGSLANIAEHPHIIAAGAIDVEVRDLEIVALQPAGEGGGGSADRLPADAAVIERPAGAAAAQG